MKFLNHYAFDKPVTIHLADTERGAVKRWQQKKKKNVAHAKGPGGRPRNISCPNIK